MQFKTREDQEYFFEEGCHIIEVMNQDEEPNLSFAQARVETGQKTRLHELKQTTEYYYITQGQGLATVANQQFMLSKGDLLKIGPGESQMIENTGSEDLIFMCICQPRFQPRNYIDKDGADTQY